MRGQSSMGMDARTARFSALYRVQFGYVEHTVRRFGVESRHVPDLIHDVFLVVYAKLPEFDDTRPVRPWLFGITFRVASAHRRRFANRMEESHEDAGAATARGRGEAMHVERDLVSRAMRRMDEDLVAVLVLCDVEGHTAPEAAEVLSTPVNTVYSRLRRARVEFSSAVESLEGEAS